MSFIISLLKVFSLKSKEGIISKNEALCFGCAPGYKDPSLGTNSGHCLLLLFTRGNNPQEEVVNILKVAALYEGFLFLLSPSHQELDIFL